MKVALVTRWRATCGVSLHAEILVGEWLRMGCEVRVYAPLVESASRDWHHKVIGDRDEPWVRRVYEEVESPLERGRFDVELVSRELISEGFDALLVEAYHRLPVPGLAELLKALRGRVTAVAVVHGSRREHVDPFVELDFDAYVVFDERYVRELLAPHMGRLKGRVCTIPYPCARPPPVKPRRPTAAEGKFMFFSFGRQPEEEYADFLRALDRLAASYDFVYYVVRSDGLLRASRPWLLQERKRMRFEELYSILKSSDVHLLPKGRTRYVVVSSTVYQTIGSLVPIVAPDTRYVETIPCDERGFGAIVKYRGLEDLVWKLKLLMEREEVRKRVSEEARRFYEERSAEKVAAQYLELLKRRLKSRGLGW